MSEHRTIEQRVCLLLTVLALAGCAKEGVGGVQQTDNREFQLDKLFTHEGCTVYRFMDAGYYRYWTDCRGKVETHHSCGKACTRPDEVDTNE